MGEIAESYGFDTLVFEYTQTGKLIIVLTELPEADYTQDNSYNEGNNVGMISVNG